MPLCEGEMMIKLSALTGHELHAVDAALSALDAALELLLDRGAANEADGVDLEELGEALAVEIECRALEDAEYNVCTALTFGELKQVVRPDGQKGYAPVG